MTTSLREQLQGIYDRVGKLTPQTVVDTARDPAHPLHSRFEWDDQVAGEAWRRQQAHELIRSVRIVYRHSESGALETVRAFHAVRSEKGHVYEPAEKVAADPVLAQIVLLDMEREWKTLKRRYEDFEEFWHMIQGDLVA